MSRKTAPVISLANFEARTEEISQQLFEAATTVGFFYVKDHGISQEEIDCAFDTGKRFLDRETEFKTTWPFNPDSYLGYRGPDELETVTGNRLWEWFSVGRWGTKGFNFREQEFEGEEWPQELGPEFREVAVSFQAQTHDVAVKILKALFIALGRDPSEIDEPFDIEAEENPSFMAWNKYPPVSPEEHEALKNQHGRVPPRLHAHADMDVLTILYNRVGDVGLEIAPGAEAENLDTIIEDVGNIWNHVPVAREWTPLDPKEGCITVNVGDGLTRWSDGVLKSTYHRVRAPKEGDPLGARYSIPYFLNPKLNYPIQGPKKRWAPVSGFDLLSKTGNAYAARKNSADKSWQEAAYSQEVSDLSVEGVANSTFLLAKNGVHVPKGAAKKTAADRTPAVKARALPVRTTPAPIGARRVLPRSALLGAGLRAARALA